MQCLLLIFEIVGITMLNLVIIEGKYLVHFLSNFVIIYFNSVRLTPDERHNHETSLSCN